MGGYVDQLNGGGKNRDFHTVKLAIALPGGCWNCPK
jgi:hypothetical protein